MRRYIAVLLAMALAFGLLAGCAQTQNDDMSPDDGKPIVQPDETGKPSGSEQSLKPADPNSGKPKEPKVFNWVVSTEASCFNPHDSNAGGNLTVVDKICSGLYGFIPSEDGMYAKLVPVLADGEPVSKDGGTTWQIKVRKDAKWADGTPIDANTFVYSWRMGLDPITMYGPCTNIAQNYITIHNASAYYKQGTEKSVKWEDVGIKALDDHTLEILCDGEYTANDVMRHFYMRYSFPVKEDLYEKCYSSDRTTNDYGTSLEKTASNGPYKLTAWSKGAEAVLSKNENWTLQELVHFDTITYREVSDESTRLELFEKGESDLVQLGANGMAKYGEDPRVASYPVSTIREIQFNHNNPDKPYLADPLFRKAVYYAVDRDTLSKLDGYIAAPFYLGVVGQARTDGTLYRELPEAAAMIPRNNGYDPALAKKYFDQAMNKYGLDKVELTLTYIETKDGQRTHSEYLMNAFEQIFGGKLILKLQAYGLQQSLKMMKVSTKEATNTWDLCWSSVGLAAEPFFPWKRAERYTSTNASRYTSYNDAVLDDLVSQCYLDENRLNEDNMVRLTLALEKQMFEQCASVPVLEETKNEMFSAGIEIPMKRHVSAVGWGWIFGNMK